MTPIQGDIPSASTRRQIFPVVASSIIRWSTLHSIPKVQDVFSFSVDSAAKCTIIFGTWLKSWASQFASVALAVPSRSSLSSQKKYAMASWLTFLRETSLDRNADKTLLPQPGARISVDPKDCLIVMLIPQLEVLVM